MPNFVAICTDKPGASEIRAAARSEHLVYIESARDRILLVGPLLSEDDQVAGSLFLVEADDLVDAKTFIENDPFAKAGLFEAVIVKRFRTHLGTLL
jgi:uncharacterized protein YciI